MVEDKQRSLVVAALDELLNWEQLVRSPHLSDFLRYIVMLALEGNSSSIKAYSIAVDVLGRGDDFDPQSDPIVRVQATRLRSLLDQFYDNNLNQVPMRISIPIGRYVPKFETLGSVQNLSPSIANVTVVDDGAKETAVRLGERLDQLWNGTGPLLAMAAIAIVMAGMLSLQILLPDGSEGVQERGVSSQVLRPVLHVTPLENLTGSPELDSVVAGFSQFLISDLARFENLDVERTETSVASGGEHLAPDYVHDHVHVDGNAFLLSGVARRTGEMVHFDLVLSNENDLSVVWSQKVQLENMGDDISGNLTAASHKFSAALGSLRGPLHLENRDLIAANPNDYGQASDYSCQILFSLARDEATEQYLDAARSCFETLRDLDPNSVVGNAGWAGMQAIALRDAPLSARVPELLFDETRSARIAVRQSPNTVFALARLAEVLAVQNKTDEALEIYRAALDVNFSDIDNRATFAHLLAFSGDWITAHDEMETVKALSSESPAWYHEVLAFDAFRQRDFQTALSDALIVVQENEKLGKILALSLAPLVARDDVVERYLEDVLTNPELQSAGIFPWLGRIVADEETLNMLRPGLKMAGVPDQAINGPFDT